MCIFYKIWPDISDLSNLFFGYVLLMNTTNKEVNPPKKNSYKQTKNKTKNEIKKQITKCVRAE